MKELRSKSAEVQRQLPQEKEMVLTSNGKPVAILTATSEDTVEESLALIRRLRAVEAVDSMQESSVQAGLDRMSLDEINGEINNARKDRE